MTTTIFAPLSRADHFLFSCSTIVAVFVLWGVQAEDRTGKIERQRDASDWLVGSGERAAKRRDESDRLLLAQYYTHSLVISDQEE